MNYAIGRRSAAAALTIATILLTPACTSPPSVAPLLRIAQRAMSEEAVRLEEDALRDAAQVEQSRRALAAGFDADLAQAGVLERGWVRDAVDAYVAAREEMVRHEGALKAARAARADNLRAAAEAQGRAIQLLEKQDDLLTQTIGLDVWRLSFTRPLSSTQPNKETP